MDLFKIHGQNTLTTFGLIAEKLLKLMDGRRQMWQTINYDH
jgi:hypothetical protein